MSAIGGKADIAQTTQSRHQGADPVAIDHGRVGVPQDVGNRPQFASGAAGSVHQRAIIRSGH